MTNGEILIDGHAGNEIGQAMRRGLIAVGGRAGEFAGAGMIAGTTCWAVKPVRLMEPE